MSFNGALRGYSDYAFQTFGGGAMRPAFARNGQRSATFFRPHGARVDSLTYLSGTTG